MFIPKWNLNFYESVSLIGKMFIKFVALTTVSRKLTVQRIKSPARLDTIEL